METSRANITLHFKATAREAILHQDSSGCDLSIPHHHHTSQPLHAFDLKIRTSCLLSFLKLSPCDVAGNHTGDHFRIRRITLIESLHNHIPSPTGFDKLRALQRPAAGQIPMIRFAEEPAFRYTRDKGLLCADFTKVRKIDQLRLRKLARLCEGFQVGVLSLKQAPFLQPVIQTPSESRPPEPAAPER